MGAGFITADWRKKRHASRFAQLEVRVDKDPVNNRHVMVVTAQVDHAAAREVEVIPTDPRGNDMRPLHYRPIKVAELRPGRSVEIPIEAWDRDRGRDIEVELSWTDDGGKHSEERRTQLPPG